MIQFDEKKSDSQLLKTLGQNKVQIILFVEQGRSLPFEYLLASSDPYLQERTTFGYMVNPSHRVREMFNLQNMTLPSVVSVAYTQENYNSKYYFLIKHYVEKINTGYTDFNSMMKFFRREAAELQWFREKYDHVLAPLGIESLNDLEWAEINQRGKNVTLSGNNLSKRKSKEVYFFSMAVIFGLIF